MTRRNFIKDLWFAFLLAITGIAGAVCWWKKRSDARHKIVSISNDMAKYPLTPDECYIPKEGDMFRYHLANGGTVTFMHHDMTAKPGMVVTPEEVKELEGRRVFVMNKPFK
ncbi:hypothetical protein LCGC14_0245650 [marine sediment metagenome]|uniref:Uncharacterized protein n=1 Tax=marine sediment metagenome TaxID=412755 RepID=A0A0F9UAI8_9ZZZZ